jgi:SAM-dependent methyltransferase
MQYHGSYEKSAHLYDFFDQKPNIGFYYRYASRFSEVLDIGSGTGRIALPLAEKGIRVCCIEPSSAMRRQFKRKLSEKARYLENIMLIGGDAGSFSLKRFFPAVFMSGVFDHLLDDAERLGVLKNIGNHLGTGGTFVFDASIVSLENNPLRQAGTFRIGSREYQRFLSSKMLTKSTKQITLVFEIYDSGNLIECIEERGVVGVVAREKILDLLNCCDFTVLNEYGDYDFTRYKEGSELLIIDAMKKTS